MVDWKWYVNRTAETIDAAFDNLTQTGDEIQAIFLQYNTSSSPNSTETQMSQQAMELNSTEFFEQLYNYVNFVTCGEFNDTQKQQYLNDTDMPLIKISKQLKFMK